MRISDWSPDVFSSDLLALRLPLSGVRLVEASAGTGKTFALTAWILRLLLERGVPLPNLLAVTFTRAATAELRARIRRRLRSEEHTSELQSLMRISYAVFCLTNTT